MIVAVPRREGEKKKSSILSLMEKMKITAKSEKARVLKKRWSTVSKMWEKNEARTDMQISYLGSPVTSQSRQGGREGGNSFILKPITRWNSHHFSLRPKPLTQVSTFLSFAFMVIHTIWSFLNQLYFVLHSHLHSQGANQTRFIVFL